MVGSLVVELLYIPHSLYPEAGGDKRGGHASKEERGAPPRCRYEHHRCFSGECETHEASYAPLR